MINSRISGVGCCLLAVSFFAGIGSQVKAEVVDPPKQEKATARKSVSGAKAYDYSAVIYAVSGLGEFAKKCRSQHDMELAVIPSRIEAEAALEDYRNPGQGFSMSATVAKFKVLEAKSKEGWEYQRCAANVRETADGIVAAEVSSIPDAVARAQFTAALSQFLTALDAVGKNTFDEEFGRYTTHANTLRLMYGSPINLAESKKEKAVNYPVVLGGGAKLKPEEQSRNTPPPLGRLQPVLEKNLSKVTMGILWDVGSIKLLKFVVAQFTGNSKAAEAGVLIGDEVIEIDGFNPFDPKRGEAWRSHKAGDQAELVVRRGLKLVNVSVTTVTNQAATAGN